MAQVNLHNSGVVIDKKSFSDDEGKENASPCFSSDKACESRRNGLNKQHAPQKKLVDRTEQREPLKRKQRGPTSRPRKPVGADLLGREPSSAPLPLDKKNLTFPKIEEGPPSSSKALRRPVSKVGQNDHLAGEMEALNMKSSSKKEVASRSRSYKKKAFSTTSLPNTKGLDTMTEEEMSKLTRLNTKKNAVRPIKARIARMKQTIEALAAPNPYQLDALPIVDPKLVDRDAPSNSELDSGSTSVEYYKPPDSSKSETFDSTFEFERQGSGSEDFDIEPASSVGQGDWKSLSKFDQPTSVRISTDVTVVERRNATDSVSHLAREDHPDRATAKSVIRQKPDCFEEFVLAGVNKRTGETPSQTRRRKLAANISEGKQIVQPVCNSAPLES